MLLPTMHVSPGQTTPAHLLQLREDILCLLPVSCHDGGFLGCLHKGTWDLSVLGILGSKGYHTTPAGCKQDKL